MPIPPVFRSTVQSIVNGELDPTTLPAGTLASICEELNKSYRAGAPDVSNRAYDDLFVGALRQIEPNHPFLNVVEPEGEDAFDGPAVRHQSPMLSTDKAYRDDELARFFRRIDKVALDEGLAPQALTYKVTPKLDGIAGHDDGGVLATRGDGIDGTDITRVIDAGFDMVGGRGLGAGELVVEQQFFLDTLQPLGLMHPRNFISGFAGADTLKAHHHAAVSERMVRFVPYSTLDCWTGGARELLDGWREIAADLRQACPYLTDGVVLELVGPDSLKATLGSTRHHHRWQLALKEKGEEVETTVSAIRLQTGRTGRITPVLEIEPVEIEGARISNVTAHTAATLIRMGLGEGAVIRVSRAGGVIPYLESVELQAETLMRVDHCPSCGSATEVDGEYVICPNTASCPAQTEARLLHWFNILGNVDLFGPVTISTIVEAGYTDLLSVYALEADDFVSMGFGPQQSANLVRELRRSQRQRIHDWRFLAAFGIRHLGRGDSRKLLERHTLTDVLRLTTEQIADVPGFGPITSPLIAESFVQMGDTIRAMLDLGFNLEVTPQEASAVDGVLSGKKIVFTGAMSVGSRDAMADHARALGATVQSSVSAKTDILVAGERAGSKLKKAEALNAGQLVPVVRILDEAGWLSLVGEPVAA